MITDPSDLELLLGQYEPGLILVGPLLSYSIGGYRYFYIAANGSKVYETIGLGVFENEAGAESKRADIIAILKGRFAEILTFDDHFEMTQAANTRWPNEETAQALASATLFMEPESGAIAQDGSIDDDNHTEVVPDDYGQQLVDEVAGDPVDRANEAIEGVPRSALPQVLNETRPEQSPSPPNMSADAPSPLGSADPQHILAMLASELELRPPSQSQTPSATTSSPPGRDRVVGEQQGHSERKDQDIAAILGALRPSSQSQSAPKLPAATTSSPLSPDRVVREQQGHSEHSDEDIAAVSKALGLPHQSRSAPKPPAVTTRSPLSRDGVVSEQQGQSERSGDLLAIMASFSRPDLNQNDVAAISRALGPSNRPQPKGARGLASLVLLLCAVGGASALVAWAMLSPGTQHMADQAPTAAPQPIARAPQSSLPDQRAASNESFELKTPPAGANVLPPPQPSQEPRAQGVTVPAAAQLQAPVSDKATRQVEPAPASVPPSPPPQPSQRASTQTRAPAPPPDHQAAANEPTRQGEPTASAPPSPPPPQPSQAASTQSGAAPASGLNHQAAANEPPPKVEPATAAAPPSPPPQPSQAASTQSGAAPASVLNHRAAANEPRPKVEPATAAAPPSPPPQPSQAASTQPGAAPASGLNHQAAANEPPPKVEPATDFGASFAAAAFTGNKHSVRSRTGLRTKPPGGGHRAAAAGRAGDHVGASFNTTEAFTEWQHSDRSRASTGPRGECQRADAAGRAGESRGASLTTTAVFTGGQHSVRSRVGL